MQSTNPFVISPDEAPEPVVAGDGATHPRAAHSKLPLNAAGPHPEPPAAPEGYIEVDMTDRAARDALYARGGGSFRRAESLAREEAQRRARAAEVQDADGIIMRYVAHLLHAIQGCFAAAVMCKPPRPAWRWQSARFHPVRRAACVQVDRNAGLHPLDSRHCGGGVGGDHCRLDGCTPAGCRAGHWTAAVPVGYGGQHVPIPAAPESRCGGQPGGHRCTDGSAAAGCWHGGRCHHAQPR